MKKRNNGLGLGIFLVIGMYAVSQISPSGDSGSTGGSGQTIAPDWAAIASWPSLQADDVEAQPNPNLTFTSIVLDDSGSMGTDIDAAKAALLSVVNEMDPEDQVSVIALNDGLILPFMPVAEARTALPEPLSRVFSDGSTPLTKAMQTARRGLEEEAARVGGFGTYRILVTTDGVADDGERLRNEIEDIARQTPIQIATIGVGLGNGHVLSRPDLATFVSVNDITGLAEALRAAIAEEQTFSAITAFGSE